MRPLGVPVEVEPLRQLYLRHQQKIRRVLRCKRSPGAFADARTLVAAGLGARRHRLAAFVDPRAVGDQQARTAAAIDEAQSRGLPPPEYAEIARKGPDHAPEFTIEARLEGGRTARATAGAKRQAEQAAARALLEAVDER